MQLCDTRKASGLEVTLQCNQHDVREFCCSNLSEATLMYFCKGIKTGTRVITILSADLEKSFIVM